MIKSRKKRIDGALKQIREALQTLTQAAAEERATEDDILATGEVALSILASVYEEASQNRRALESAVANIESYVKYVEEHIN